MIELTMIPTQISMWRTGQISFSSQAMWSGQNIGRLKGKSVLDIMNIRGVDPPVIIGLSQALCQCAYSLVFDVNGVSAVTFLPPSGSVNQPSNR